MKKIIFIGAVVLSATARLWAAYSLDDCFKKAQALSENLQIQDQQIAQARQRVRQSIGSSLPNFHFLASEYYQDTLNTDAGSGGVGGTLARTERPESKFTLVQPLFTGFREWETMRGLQSQEEAEKYLKHDLLRQLYLNVANAFYAVVLNETQIRDLQQSLTENKTRGEELKRRINIGKSRDSELLATESQIASVEAQIRFTVGSAQAARAQLAYLTGLDVNAEIADSISLSTAALPIENYLRRAQGRSEIAALRAEVDANRRLYRAAQRAFSPYAYLTGNYYVRRVGFQESAKWDATFTVDLPIFQGGQTLAAMRLAQAELTRAELSAQRLERVVKTQVAQAHVQLVAALAEVEQREVAYQRSKQSYDLQVKEYRLGLVNNLEVLDSLRSLQDSHKNLDESKLRVKLAFYELRAATEDLPK